MKQKISYILFAAILALVSCSEDELNKADYDYTSDPSKAPTGAVTSNVASIGIFEATFTGSVQANVATLSDWGVLVYQDESSYVTISAKESGADFTVSTNALKDDTEYKYKAFAINESGVIYGSEQTFRTKEMPKFEDTYILGTYDAIDIDIQTGEQEGGVYPVTIEQDGTIYNRIKITNIWGGETTIGATIDFETKTITTDVKSVVYVDDTYGNCWMQGFDIVGGKAVDYPTAVAIADYDDQGNVTFRNWAARVSAGSFGYYVTELTKQ